MASDGGLVVHPRWRDWVTQNLVEGASRKELVEALVEENVDEPTASALVASIASEPGTVLARRFALRAKALELIVRLRREHRGPEGRSSIERRPLPSAEEFLARYWRPGVPAVFTDLVPRWPAFGRWSLRDFAERFGDVELEASVGRDAVERPDADWKQVRRRLPLRELVRRIESGAGNDAYVIAKNDALRNPGLRPLLQEIALPSELFPDTLEPRRMALWLGGGGTHTPLHHDTDNSMFSQVYGKKRFRLAPPESIALLEHSDGLYSRDDPRSPDALADLPDPLFELELAAGEALFIPAGWWHQVDALEPSISVSNLHWVWPNDFGWYKPGTALAGRDVRVRPSGKNRHASSTNDGSDPGDENAMHRRPR